MKTANKRPLSPHLQVYKPQITTVLSIMHRATGTALAVGTLLVTYWLSSIAGGEESFNSANAILGSWFGRLILFFWSWALFYHLSNGIRHLLWDSGYGFDLPTVYKSGKIAVGASLALTILLWLVV